ncbi:MAG: hypothetical protein Q7S55_02880 [Nanoarchaeota archaeon]|nr:hypothetical protein [Nanoarchaeota archaeon]
MSSLHALQLLTTAARLAQQEHEFIPKAEITKKLEDIKYLSSQKKVPRLSLRKEIIHLESQLQGILGLEERFARQKDKESITVASLKQQIMALKNKLRAVEDLELDKKVEHLSFLLGEHLAKREVASEVAMTKAAAIPPVPVEAPASEEKGEAAEYGTDEKHQASLDVAKKAAMLQKRLDSLKREAEIHRELETKNPQEMLLIEEKIKLFEEKLQQYYEQHPEAMLQEMASVEVPADFEVKHKLLFPQTEKTEEGMSEEVREAERMLPLPPPPRMRKRG